LVSLVTGWESATSGTKYWLDLGVVQPYWGSTAKVRTAVHLTYDCVVADQKGGSLFFYLSNTPQCLGSPFGVVSLEM